MKDFKIVDNKYECEECHLFFKSKNGLSNHVNKKHNIKIYYDKWLKNENEGFCEICGKETKFRSIKYNGYYPCCSKKCVNKHREKICLQKYGVNNINQNNEIKIRRKKVNMEKLGVEYPMQNENVKNKRKENYFNKHGIYHQMKDDKIKNKIKNTNIKKYGTPCSLSNDSIKIKRDKTWLEKYGTKYIFQSEKIKEKSKITCLKKYGVENASQNHDIFIKQQKSSFIIKKYKDTNLLYQGSYELDFLNKYYNELQIENGKTIKYKYNNKEKSYHSDFFIPDLNLIVEIKNSWLYKRDLNILNEKEKSTLEKGYNYILILDKNYDEFKKIIQT
jgi:hypothetical protein